MEDYLKAAYRLEQDGGPVTTQKLAEELGLSQPSVTNMVKRMDELKLVIHNRYHGISLTATGRSVALEVIRHHRLLELYLAEALGTTSTRCTLKLNASSTTCLRNLKPAWSSPSASRSSIPMEIRFQRETDNFQRSTMLNSN